VSNYKDFKISFKAYFVNFFIIVSHKTNLISILFFLPRLLVLQVINLVIQDLDQKQCFSILYMHICEAVFNSTSWGGKLVLSLKVSKVFVEFLFIFQKSWVFKRHRKHDLKSLEVISNSTFDII